MKYIIFTADGFGFPLAQHLLDEGQNVTVGRVLNYTRVYTDHELVSCEEESSFWKERRLSIYKNIIHTISADILVEELKRVRNPQEYFIFFDQNYLFSFAEELVDLGFHGNFPTKTDRVYEIDRNKAKKFVKKYYSRVKLAEYKNFSSVASASKFLKSTKKHWVIKSQSPDLPTFVSFCQDMSTAREQLLENLHEYKEEYQRFGFLLEEKIDNLVEVTPEKMYYNGVPICMTLLFENKYLGSGNLSYQVGCAQDAVVPVPMDGPLHDIAFPPIVDQMAREHRGLFIWDASLLIDSISNEIYFGEFCPNRVGYNSFFSELIQMPSVHHFFETIIHQKNPFKRDGVGVSVTMFNLSHTLESNELVKDFSVFVSSIRKQRRNIWPFDIYKKRQNDRVRLAGYLSEAVVITGSGRTVEEAISEVYNHIKSIEFSQMYYRPQFDFLSTAYQTSILNRIAYCESQQYMLSPHL